MTGDAHRLLRRAIERSADAAGVPIAIAGGTMTRWASATFAGGRHEMRLELPAGSAATAWLATLPEAELWVRDHLVADLKLIRTEVVASLLVAVIEILTVEER